MTNQYILSFDPGVSTGVALLAVPDDYPAYVVTGWQFGGGVEGLVQWVRKYLSTEGVITIPGPVDITDGFEVISEKFKPINHSNYALTTDSVEPLRCEGALVAYDVMPASATDERWRKPGDHYVVGGKNLAEKKKRLRAFLKDTENYRMPKELGTPDSDDFASAAGHALTYAMKVLNHRPTFDLVREYVVRLDDKENK